MDSTTPDARSTAPHLPWHSWGSPVGLGIGLLCVGAFFTLLTLGLSVLAAVGA